MTIYKYQLKITSSQKIYLPLFAEILTAQIQEQSGLCLWAKVNEQRANISERTIEMFGTGHPMSKAQRRYINTIQQDNGALIWHIFEKEI